MWRCFGKAGEVDWAALATTVEEHRSGCPQFQETNRQLVSDINTLANSSAVRVPAELRRRLAQAGVLVIPRK